MALRKGTGRWVGGLIRSVAGLGSAAMLVLGGCARHTGISEQAADATLPETEYTVLRGETYSPADWPQALQADVYLPEGAGPHPAVLVVHGGGWERRSPEDMDGICEHLASHGFVAVNIAYRFAPDHLFPAQLHDLQQAMRWIHANAARFRIDVQRIGGLGYSSGAHLVSLLAVTGDDDELDQPYGGDHSRLRAVVAGGTPADLRPWPKSPLVRQFLGKERDEAPALWASASPITHVDAGDPPFFLYHGGLDRLVVADQARNMKAALDRVDVHAELYIVPYHGHVSMFALNHSAIDRGTEFLARQLMR